MTDDEHKARHVELHRALDELFADYIKHHPEQRGFISMPVIDLIRWSHEQTQHPTSWQTAPREDRTGRVQTPRSDEEA